MEARFELCYGPHSQGLFKALNFQYVETLLALTTIKPRGPIWVTHDKLRTAKVMQSYLEKAKVLTLAILTWNGEGDDIL